MAKISAEEMIKRENAEAADWLLNYHARLNQYQEDCARFAILRGTECDDMPHSSDVGNPTQKLAMQLEDLHRQRDWLDVVELAESTLSEKKRMFLKFRRLAADIKYKKEVGRPGFYAYVSVLFAEWHIRTYGIHVLPADRTMLEWWDEIVNIVVRIALRKGGLL